MTVDLTVYPGGSATVLGDDERLHAAQMAIVDGYQQAVDILSPTEGDTRHPELGWFEEGLSNCREIAGLPRLRVLSGSAGH